MATIGSWSAAEMQTRLDALAKAAEAADPAKSAELVPQISEFLDEARMELARDSAARATVAGGEPARLEIAADRRVIAAIEELHLRVSIRAATVGKVEGAANGFPFSARVLEVSPTDYDVRGSQNGYPLRIEVRQNDTQILLRGSHNGHSLRARISQDPSGDLHAEGTHAGHRLSFELKRVASGGYEVSGTHSGRELSLEVAPTGNGGAEVKGTHAGHAFVLSLVPSDDGLAIDGTLNGQPAFASYANGVLEGTLNGRTLKTSSQRDVTSPLGTHLVDGIALPFPTITGDAGDALQLALWAILTDPKRR